MKKKGFTLIELLATIVIISVIATITTAVVLNVVEEARKNTFILNVQKILDTTDYYKVENKIDNLGSTGVNIRSLDFKFKDSYRGKVIEKDGALYSKIITDGVYCAIGTKNNLKVTKGDCSTLDNSKPILEDNLISTVSTTKSIKVILNTNKIVEDESYIEYYQYILTDPNDDTFIKDSGKVESTVDPSYIFEDLKQNYTYNLKVVVINFSNLSSEVEMTVKTDEINVPTASMEVVNGVESSNGIFTKDKVIVNITYDVSKYDYNYTNYYCISSTTSCSTWQTTANSNLKLDITENSYILMKITDGVNTLEGSTLAIANIDREAPTDLTIKNPTNENWTKSNFSLTLSATDNNKVGISKYEYSFDNSAWTSYSNSDVADNASFTTTEFTKERNQLVYIRVCDKLNNCSNSSSTYIRIDKTGPTITLGTVTSSTNSITIPYTLSDSQSGIGSYTCKYGTSSGSYTTNGSSVTNTSCKLTGLTKNTTYYYQVCATDKVGNETCKTGSKATLIPTNPSISLTKTPSSTQNGYLKKEVATITYSGTNITSPTYYVKTTRAATGSLSGTPCGTGTNPGTCSGTATTSYAANTWYKVSGNVTVTYSTSADSTATLYAITYDGTNYSGSVTATIDKIDVTSPPVTLGTVTSSTNSITIPYTMSDSQSGISSYTCKYGTSSGSYTTNGSSVTSTSCKLTGLTKSTTYYYQICATDKVGNETCKTGSKATLIPTNPSISLSKTPSSTQNGYLKKEVATITYSGTNITSPTYYLKTTRTATGSLSVTPCGTGTNPGTCSGTATTSYAANTWYKVSGNVTVTYSTSADSTATLYAITYDGTNYSGSVTATIDKIDVTSPPVTLGTVTSSTNSITIPYTMSDSQSGVYDKTCMYGTSSGSYTTYATWQTSGSTTTCVIPNLTQNKTYYYQICAVDRVGNAQTCKTGSKATLAITNPSISLSKTPSSTQNGYLKKEVATITYSGTNITSPTYYVKTTRAATGSLSGTPCGTGTNPGTCSGTATTSYAANTWYKVSGNVSVTYSTSADSTATLYAITYDGTNYSGSVTATIDKIDVTSPTVTLGNVSSNTNSITIPYTLSDSQSGISNYTCKYGSVTTSVSGVVTNNYSYTATSVTSTSCKISGLSANTKYSYQICATDKVGNTTTCKTSTATTPIVEAPTISLTKTPSSTQNGYLKKEVATITYSGTNITSPSYYVKTTRAATGSLSGTPCGTGTKPGTCSGTATTSYAANTWYKVSGNISVTYSTAASSTATLYAITSDGVNYSTSSTATINKIDVTAPTCSTSGESTVWTNGSRTIYVNCSDSESGCTSSSSITKAYTSGATKTETVSYTLSDNVGNTSTCSKTINVYVDMVAPTCASSGGTGAYWKNTDVTITGTCSDNLSGCKQSTVTKKYTTTTSQQWTSQSPGTVYDNAGNSVTCPANQSINIDKVAPTLTISTTYCTESKPCTNNHTLSASATDSASGVVQIKRRKYFPSDGTYSSWSSYSGRCLYSPSQSSATCKSDTLGTCEMPSIWTWQAIDAAGNTAQGQRKVYNCA